MENLILAFAVIGVLGVGAQWIAWRFNLPGIVLMSIAGVVAGPVTGFLWPVGYDPAIAAAPPMETLFGEFYRPIIGVAVAVILFEGGLTLNFSEIKDFGRGVRRLVMPGAPLAWGFGALAARYIGGLTWEAAILFSGVMVVTGPTVIIPLLRQSKLQQRPAALLKWEGIVNDPLGAIFAVFAYEIVTIDLSGVGAHSPSDIIGALIIGSALAAGWGFALGRGVAQVFRRGWAPEYLKPPLLLIVVLVCFEVANLLQEEAGLVAVTAMGVTIANSRISSINELRLFKENVAILLVSGVFIILTANLTWGTIGAIDGQAALLIAAMLFLVRPLAVFLSTIGAGLPLKERILVAWIAPRGIVAVAVTSFFGAAMVAHFSAQAAGIEGVVDTAARDALAVQIESAEKLIPLAFAMVFATVVLHGFTIGPLSKALGLSFKGRAGVLISGATNWSTALAEKLFEMDIPVVIADPSWRRLAPARLANVPTYYGEILSEVTEHHLDLNRFGVLIAISSNEAHNALVCTDLAPEMGRAAIYQVNARGKDEEDRRALSYTLQGRTFLHKATPLDVLQRRMFAGWTFQRTRLSAEYTPEQYLADLGEEREIILVVRRGELVVASAEAPITLAEGDVVLTFAPKQETAKAASEKAKLAADKAAAAQGAAAQPAGGAG